MIPNEGTDPRLPALIVVSGPPGSGKTTLAHQVAGAVGCPAVCRDEIKEGMAHAVPGFTPAPGDALTMRTLTVFFDVIGLLLRAGVTTVAEAAFQDRVWRQHDDPAAGGPAAFLRRVRAFDRLSAVPSLDVDTTNGYRPDLATVVAFVSS